MTKVARKHHVTPIFYLKGFTLRGVENDSLWCLDLERSKQFQQTPKSLGYVNEFHSVEGNCPSDCIEVELGKIEGDIAPVIGQIRATETLPKSDSDWNILINFIALMSTKTKKIRMGITHHSNEAIAQLLENKFHSTEKYLEWRDKQIANGEREILSHEDIKIKIENRDFGLSFHNNFFVEQMLTSVEHVLPHLWKRSWMLYKAPTQSFEIVSSDAPVSLVWTRSDHPDHPPGHASPDSMVIFPISRQLVLAGTSGGNEGAIGVVPESYVLHLNGVTTRGSFEFVYSARPDFSWLNQRGEICTSTDLVTLWENSSVIPKRRKPLGP